MGTNPLVDDPRGYGPAYASEDPFAPLGGSSLVFGPQSPIVHTGFLRPAFDAAGYALAAGKTAGDAFVEAGNAAKIAGATDLEASAAAVISTLAKGKSQAQLQSELAATGAPGALFQVTLPNISVSIAPTFVLPWQAVAVAAGILAFVIWVK